MSKPLKTSSTWSVTHLLALSLAFNIGLILRLSYNEKDRSWSENHSSNNNICISQSSSEKKMGKGGRDTTSVVEVVMRKAEVNGKDQSDDDDDRHQVVIINEEEEDDDDDRIINLDHGDPTMYEKFWKQASNQATIVIPGWQSMSYFSNTNNLCWFMEPELLNQITRLHGIVGNAVTTGNHIIVGTGSTQLFQAALYALSTSLSETETEDGVVSVVSAMPYYSFYKQVIEYLKPGHYKWVGDVSNFNGKDPYIEVITSPNNPDGYLRNPVMNGMQIHDYAYYWPQYTPITHPADQDVMLFTVSKTTGHAGMRIGWALVKDEQIAKRMVKFIELSSIGVSKDSQLRAAKILQTVSDSTEGKGGLDNFFDISYQLVDQRWKMLREVVGQSNLFSLPEFPSSLCQFSNRTFQTQPAFAWLKCEGEVEDCEAMLKGLKILTRSGKAFGMSSKYVRISMLDRDANFNLFLKRLRKIQQNC